MNPVGQKNASILKTTKSFTQNQPRNSHTHLIQNLPKYTAPNTIAVASPAAAPFRYQGVAAARAIQHILLGEISCRSQRIDSTQNRGWVVQLRD